MQHYVQSRPPARPVPIEIDGEPVGIAVPVTGGVRFVAVRLAAFGSDGRVFPSPAAAQAAIAEDISAAQDSTARS